MRSLLVCTLRQSIVSTSAIPTCAIDHRHRAAATVVTQELHPDDARKSVLLRTSDLREPIDSTSAACDNNTGCSLCYLFHHNGVISAHGPSRPIAHRYASPLLPWMLILQASTLDKSLESNTEPHNHFPSQRAWANEAGWRPTAGKTCYGANGRSKCHQAQRHE